MIKAVVFGKEDCGICKSAADKLALLNIPYTKEDIDKVTQLHDGWQNDDAINVMTAFCVQNKHMPVIKLDFGDGEVKFLSYPDAMSALKERTGRKSQTRQA